MEPIAVSTSLGRPAYFHDMRITLTPNIKRDLIGDNIVVIDKLKGRSVDDYLDELLQPHIDEYNEKQKRADRKISCSYTEWHRQDKRKGALVYEVVMQYGDKDTLGKAYFQETDPEKKKALREEMDTLYRKWLDDWQKQHPGMVVLWAVGHYDETTVHYHCAFTALGSMKRGPGKQVSLQKCLEEAGFPRKGTKREGYQLARAFEKFREIQEKDLRDLGYEIKPPKRGRHQEPEIFREVEAAKDDLKITQEQIQENEQTIQAQEARAAQAVQVVAQAKDLAQGYIQEAQEAIQTREQEEARSVALAEQNARQTTQIDQGKRDLQQMLLDRLDLEHENQEIERRIELSRIQERKAQQEADTMIKGVLEVSEKMRDLQANQLTSPEIISRKDKDRWGKPLARPIVEIYEDDLQKVVERARWTESIKWAASKLEILADRLADLFHAERLTKPLEDRAKRAEDLAQRRGSSLARIKEWMQTAQLMGGQTVMAWFRSDQARIQMEQQIQRSQIQEIDQDRQDHIR